MVARTFLALLVLVHLLLALVAPVSGQGEIIAAIHLQLGILAGLFLAGASLLFARIAWKRMENPAFVMLRVARRHQARIIEGSVFLIILALVMQIYMMLKVALPKLVPFYADPIWADFDAAIFGRDPWIITHQLLGDEATRLLDFFYVTPCLLVAMAMSLWACFAADRSFSRRAVLAIALSWFGIGIWLATALSSAGPAFMDHFYGDQRFAPLLNALPPDLIARQTQDYLLENFGVPGFGKGISAMPSMHNSIYILLVFMVHDRFGPGWQMWCAIAFEAIVFVASVHLGWHYAVDTLFAAALVPGIWFAAGWIERTRMPDPRLSTAIAGVRRPV